MGRLSSPPARLGSAPYRLALAPADSAQRRTELTPWRPWYSTARWRELRMRTFKRDHYTCQWPGCGKVQGNPAMLVCDHRRRHGGRPDLFWDEANLQTLCKSPCHDKHKQRQEAEGRRLGDGWD